MNKKYLIYSLKTLLAVALLMPLFIGLDSYLFPFIVPKALFFRSVVAVAFIIYLALIWDDKKYLPQKNLLLLVTGLFLLATFLSAVFGVDFTNSWWGNFERMEGVHSLLYFYLYLVMVVGLFKTKKDYLFLLNIVLGVGVLVMLLGVIQYFAPQDKPFLTVGGSNRVYSTLGNFIYYGQYGLAVFWLSWLLLFFADKAKTYLKFIYGATALTGVVGLFLAGSRGPFLSLFISLIVFGLGLLFITKNKKIKIAGLVGSLIVLVLVGTAIFSSSKIFSSVPAISGLHEIYTRASTANTRIMAWEIAWKGFLDRPVLGWGWFNYHAVYDKHYNPKFLEHGWGETWFDHAHNQYFDVLATTGAVGLISYLAIFVFMFYGLWRLYKHEKISAFVWLASCAFIIGHLVNNFFVFEHLSSYLLLFVFIGFICVLSNLEKEPTNNIKLNKFLSIGLDALIIIVFVFNLYFLYYGNYMAYKANTTTRNIIVAFQSKPAEVIKQMVQYSDIPNAHQRDVRAGFTKVINSVQPIRAESAQAGLYREFLNNGTKILEDHIKDFPTDTRRKLLLTQMYKDIYLAGDTSVTKRMEELFVDLSKQSPQRQQVYYYWPELKLFEDKYDEAIKLVEKTIIESDKIYNGYWLLTKIEGSRSNWQKAREYLGKALERGMEITDSNRWMINTINDNSSSTVK